jgi:hypothetical protein
MTTPAACRRAEWHGHCRRDSQAYCCQFARTAETFAHDLYSVVQRRVVETRTTVYQDPQQTRYIRDDGYDQDDGN